MQNLVPRKATRGSTLTLELPILLEQEMALAVNEGDVGGG